MAKYGLGERDVRHLFSKMQGKVDAAIQATLQKAVDDMLKNINTYWLGKGALDYLGVTGNAYASIAFGVYHNNKLVYANWNGKHVDKPTMRSLRKGQRYPLPEYYDGDKNKGYVGEYGRGGQWGQQTGPWIIYSQRYNKSLKSKDWSVVVVLPMEYAGYNPKIVKAMQNMLDDLPDRVDYNIVRVENAPSQTDAFKDFPF